MTKSNLQHCKEEYESKRALAESIEQYYIDRRKELNLDSFDRIGAYLKDKLGESNYLVDRGIIFSHLDFDKIATLIAKGEEFVVVSGLNPSSPLHLGHKVLFYVLLMLQKLGATLYIPITNDESYLDNKAASLKESRKIAYENIIPDILAFGFDPDKTKIYVLSDYPEIYNFAIDLSKHVKPNRVEAMFGSESVANVGQLFYRAAVQLAQILLPQLPEFGGVKHTLIPVGIDQHPYIFEARNMSRKVGMKPPSELIFKFLGGLQDPSQKMSGSKPETAIYMTDTEDEIRRKISGAYTGSVSLLSEHRKLGAVPEACSVFNLLKYHHPDNDYVAGVRERYASGDLTAKELKGIAIEFIISMLAAHKERKITQRISMPAVNVKLDSLIS